MHFLRKLAFRLIDRRSKFRDMRRIRPPDRFPRSHILQFYSSSPNIGNYLPVLGIHKMLGFAPDTWCIHDKQIDFDFINTHYKRVIIGGAGLLHGCFTRFWKDAAEHCKIPIAIWGVGLCLPDERVPTPILPVSKALAGPVFESAEFINVRDHLTAEYYGLSLDQRTTVTPCPTIAYLRDRIQYKTYYDALVSPHSELTGDSVSHDLVAKVNSAFSRTVLTTNVQDNWMGLEDIVKLYCRSRLVVTTRLHGAIIAYGLRKPYIALSFDNKLDSFHAAYGNGVLVRSLQEIDAAVEAVRAIECSTPQYEEVEAAGAAMREWLISECSGSRWPRVVRTGN